MQRGRFFLTSCRFSLPLNEIIFSQACDQRFSISSLPTMYKIQPRRMMMTYVPNHRPTSDVDVNRLRDFLVSNKGKTVVVTGAGISTESGIPDYRSDGVGLYARSDHKPTSYQEFVRSPHARKRYWARSFVGWPKFSSVLPNSTHQTLSLLEANDYISCIVTQNVDNLHQKAGTKRVIELHGTLYRVHCLSCSYTIDRHHFQNLMNELNPKMCRTSDVLRPDGDVELRDDEIASFVVPPCSSCGSYVKPDVVFFGDNVPADRVQLVKRTVDDSSSILVLGSSLSVFSAYRIILQAVNMAKPVCIVNIGNTRADDVATVKIDAKCGDILPAAYNLIAGR